MIEVTKDSLDRKRLRSTIERLEWRIEERFPGSSLRRVCAELSEIAVRIEDDLSYIGRPNWWLRGATVAFVVATLGVLVLGAALTELPSGRITLVELIQILEAGLNNVVLIGAAIVFLVSFEVRAKRRRVIAAVNRLRSIAHVIDMHQLTKDPSIIVAGSTPTAHSPAREMSTSDLARYLDYCSELLALTSKVGFCYVQDFDDSQAVAAINELENLTTGLSGKVWQKIMLMAGST